jgi:pimeloyl-ACP methyl ester carboxylesterase
MLLQRAVIYVLLFIVILYLFVAMFLVSKQTDMIYAGYTQPVTPADALQQAKNAGLIPWEQTTPGASGPQGYVPPDFAAPAPRGTIVFFHGNGESAWLWADQIPAFSKRGFRVFMYEYPGYGGRPGVPSEKTIVPDAQAVVRALDQAGYGPIYLWGVSLGTGVAAAVCADPTVPVKGVTLVCPWDNIANVGLSYYPWLPVRFLLIDKYDSIANLQHFGRPICVMRGDRDETIIPALSIDLYAHLPNPKKMILQAGYGHGDWPDTPDRPFWDDALDFMAPKK